MSTDDGCGGWEITNYVKVKRSDIIIIILAPTFTNSSWIPFTELRRRASGQGQMIFTTGEINIWRFTRNFPSQRDQCTSILSKIRAGFYPRFVAEDWTLKHCWVSQSLVYVHNIYISFGRQAWLRNRNIYSGPSWTSYMEQENKVAQGSGAKRRDEGNLLQDGERWSNLSLWGIFRCNRGRRWLGRPCGYCTGSLYFSLWPKSDWISKFE